MKIAYYTSGIPGTGRIVQGISIYNALKRKGVKCNYTIVSSTPLARIADTFAIPHIEIPLEDDKALSRDNYSSSFLYKTLIELSPDILIVDRMWFTLYHFIQKLKCVKIFFSIQVDDRFFAINLADEMITFKPEQYDRILAIEPFKCSIAMDQINPIIIRNRDEIYDKKTALLKLGINGLKKVCLIALNYKEGYFERLKTKYSYLESAGYDIIYTTNVKGGGIFPIVDYYNAIDLVVGAAGYTQFWEVIYFQKEAIFETFPLHFSNMKWRLNECQDYSFNENGADQLVNIMLSI